MREKGNLNKAISHQLNSSFFVFSELSAATTNKLIIDLELLIIIGEILMIRFKL